jgi:hypothetical protein
MAIEEINDKSDGINDKLLNNTIIKYVPVVAHALVGIAPNSAIRSLTRAQVRVARLRCEPWRGNQRRPRSAPGFRGEGARRGLGQLRVVRNTSSATSSANERNPAAVADGGGNRAQDGAELIPNAVQNVSDQRHVGPGRR